METSKCVNKMCQQNGDTTKSDCYTTRLIFYVNGRKVEDPSPDPEMTLLTYLRTKLQLTGSKLGCGEGGCGACTVMLSKYNKQTDNILHYSANACLTPICSVHGLAVTTVEGIGNTDKAHPVQERIAKFHGSQCGFCTPGIVMSMYALLRNNPNPSSKEMHENFDGNLCRCTGYRSILDGFRTFTKEFTCAMGKQCCKNTTNGVTENNENVDHESQPDVNLGNMRNYLEVLGPKISSLRPYDPSQEPIFPPDLKVHHVQYHDSLLYFTGPRVTWYRPTTLQQLLTLKGEHPNARLIVGNTEIGIETKFKGQNIPVLISCTHIPELTAVVNRDHGLEIGGSVTLSQLDKELRQRVETLEEHKTRIFVEVCEMLKWFASNQIRNVACVSGNIITASPISDLNPLFVASGVLVNVVSKERGHRELKMDETFFCGYRKTALAADEILVSIVIPYTKPNEYFCGFKQCNRKEDDISMVNTGMFVSISEENTVEKAMLAFGGMAVTVVVAQQAMRAAIGRKWDTSLVSTINDLLAKELILAPGSPGGAVEYRRALALGFFFKFFLVVQNKIGQCELGREFSGALESIDHTETTSIQVVGGQDSRSRVHDCVGQAIPHRSALQQSTGQAVYVDDMTPIKDELHLALVTSTRSNATIKSIDFTPALAAPGVVDVVSASDVPGQNALGIVMATIFADKEVTCQGQIIGGVMADSIETARSAAKLVRIEYEDRQPVILTIEDAIRRSSFYPITRNITHGDVERGLKESSHTLTGEIHMNGQNHFYLETMATRALPGEIGEMEVFCSTQHPGDVQVHIAEALGVDNHKVVVRTKRMGGGFGGKETQSSLSAVPCAVAARKTGRPVRCVFDRDEDMVITGNRHPFYGKYKVGFNSEGKLHALDLELYNNAGNSLDLSAAVMERALLQVDSCYKFSNMRIRGFMCKTNIMSNTAFRGFGGIQGSFIADAIVEDVADFLRLDPLQVRERNFFDPTDITYYGMASGGESVRRCWDLCLARSDYRRRKEEVNAYNRNNRWKKKGLAITPVRFGISFLQAHMNQGCALIHIYTDGSVLIAHGGTEMGQGLHTKMIQMASEVLKVPMSRIHISETATNTVANAMPTAASVSTDLYGLAVKEACEILMKRMENVRAHNPDASWYEIIQASIRQRVNLSAIGYYKTPGVGYNFATQEGQPVAYFTFGAACSEVQIDCLTGDHKLLRTDLVMDVGNSVNPAIDVGQIEGAFTQGYGLLLLEDIKVNPNGAHLTRGPGNYKIPSFGNIPTEMNVHLVPDSPNPKGAFFSRGIGEPPLLLAISTFFAVKDAIKAARHESGADRRFRLDSPALPQHIRMACSDEITQKFPEADPNSYRPWTVKL